jgi:glycosyltransferase involved in cell wall biosynthesis
VSSSRLRVFLCAPEIDPAATGEGFVAWKWAEALSEIVDLTVFTFQYDNRPPVAETLPKARALTAPRPKLFSRMPRFEAMAKPHYPFFMRAVRKALADNPGAFDIAHQIMPQAARYPSPLFGTSLPYVIGPLGGTLETPAAFRAEASSAVWFTRLRALDALRLRNDPWLRRSYAGADLLLGVGPYMRDILGTIDLKRFEPLLELGVSDLPSLPKRQTDQRAGLKLLHVGRGVRTKGLRDVIRAMGHLKDVLPEITLISAGAGEEIEICRREAVALGIADRVTFKGLIARDEVETLYQDADIFVFPSFREPGGNVVYEAMRWGVPVIVAARGGPNWSVDETTGLRIPVTTPERYASDIAQAIKELADDPARRRAMGLAGRAKLEREALWPLKAEVLVGLYEEVVAGRQAAL